MNKCMNGFRIVFLSEACTKCPSFFLYEYCLISDLCYSFAMGEVLWRTDVIALGILLSALCDTNSRFEGNLSVSLDHIFLDKIYL